MNKFKLILASSFWLLLTAISCNRDDINFENPSQLLRFSADTVFLDTVYNQVRSETYAVKIYNNEDKDVMIPKISLEGIPKFLNKQTNTELVSVHFPP